MTFGYYIKAQRKKKKLTQHEVASLLHVDRSLISRFESDECVPNAEVVRQLSKVLEVELDEMESVLKSNLKKQNLFRNVLFVSFATFAIACILILLIPFWSYPGYPLPASKTHHLIHSSVILMCLNVHNPLALITLLVLFAYLILIVLFMFFQKRIKPAVIINCLAISSVVVFLLFAITLFISINLYLHKFN